MNNGRSAKQTKQITRPHILNSVLTGRTGVRASITGVIMKERKALYDRWSKLSQRSDNERSIIFVAGKHNCLVLSVTGNPTNCNFDGFSEGSRYCLRPDYVIPPETAELVTYKNAHGLWLFDRPGEGCWHLNDAGSLNKFMGHKWADGRVSRLLDGPIGEWPVAVMWLND